MSRVIDSILLLAIACTAAPPALFAIPDSKLPACCRRGGAHPCSMAEAPDASNAAHVKAAAERCPYFPKASSPARGANCAAPTCSIAAILSGFSHPRAASQTEVRYRVALGRGWQKRGPPSLA